MQLMTSHLIKKMTPTQHSKDVMGTITCKSCDKPRYMKSTYCVEHKCNKKDCKSVAYNGGFCAVHKCHKCKTQSVSNSLFCFEHKCGLCDLPRIDGFDYCCECKCNQAACSKNRYYDSMSGVTYLHCNDHRCTYTNCDNPAERDKKCIFHGSY